MIARWDARWKLAAILLACGLSACLQELTAAALAIALTLARLAHISFRKLAARLALILLSLIPFLLVLPFEDGGTALALTIALRALAIGIFACVLLLAEPLPRTLAAAQSLGVPGSLVQITLLAHRYAFTLFDEVRLLRRSWRVRGFQPATNAHTYRTYGSAVGAILVRSGDRGDRVHAAMAARGFDGTFHCAVPFRTTPADVAGFLLLAFAMAGLLAWDRLR